MKKKAKVIPWDKFFGIERPDPVTIQVIPDRTINNTNTELLAKALYEFYKPLYRRFHRKGFKLIYSLKDFGIFEIHYEHNSIKYFFVVPRKYLTFLRQKIETIWPRVTISETNKTVQFDPAKTEVANLKLRNHNFYAFKVDKRENAPVPALLNVSRDIQEGDKALLQIVLSPVDRLVWSHRAQEAYNKLREHGNLRKLEFTPREILRTIAFILDSLFEKLSTALTTYESPITTLMEKEMMKLTSATTNKAVSPVFSTTIRVLAESEEKERARITVRAITNSFKDLAADNELESVEVMEGLKKRFIRAAEMRKPGTKISNSILSTGEVGRLLQLPTGPQLIDFPAVEQIARRETTLPDELFQEEGIPLGNVTEKGVTRTARIPIRAYGDVKLKHVYDALCLPSFGFGKMGTGKSDGYGTNWAMGFIKNGFSAFIMDTADGQVIKTFEDSLPADYPEHKLIHLNLEDKRWPIALNWGDSMNRKLDNCEDDLAVLEVSQRLTDRLVEFLSNNATTVFTDRMKQYLISCCRAVFTRSDWSFLDIELALKSPAYREELLADPAVLTQPDVCDDLRSLQKKAETDADGPIIDPILSRLKMLSNNPFIGNLFLQRPKVSESGNPLLDFRHFMDNPEGGYGYTVCIHCSSDAYDSEGQELVLGFITDKINLAGFSRVDINQDQRKPVLTWTDEPHKVITKVARYYKNGSVEFRKYRVKLLWTGHNKSQMGDAADALDDGGCQYTAYKTENVKAYQELGNQFNPYTPEEIYQMLPEKWEAINKVRLPSGQECQAFVAKMTPPPAFVKSRETRREECAKQFGRHWKEVYEEIQARRSNYQRNDDQWRSQRQEEVQLLKEALKQAEKEAKSEARKAEKEKKAAADKTEKPGSKKRKSSNVVPMSKGKT